MSDTFFSTTEESVVDISKLDKFYTPQHIVDICTATLHSAVNVDTVTEYIEPSAGSGAFLPYLQSTGKPYKCYDILPENDLIHKADFIKLSLPYKKGRCILGNPPFGRGNSLAVSFFKKSVAISDYIAFVLPISQLDNNRQMYEFDMVASVDLGKAVYSGAELHCCFNVYKRPEQGLNSKPITKPIGYHLVEWRRGCNRHVPEGFVYGMGTFGAGGVGKRSYMPDTYCIEVFVYCDDVAIKDKLLHLCETTDWKAQCKSTSGNYRLPQHVMVDYLNKELYERPI